MAAWVEVGAHFIIGDVIRFDEAVWERRGVRSKRVAHVGDRTLIAEVLAEPDKAGFVELVIVASSGDAALKKDETVRRKLTTIVRTRTDRLEWSDETVRARLILERGAGWQATVIRLLKAEKPKGRNNYPVGGRKRKP